MRSIAIVLTLATLSLSAAQRQRPVKIVETLYTGRVIDAISSRPVIDAEIISGTHVAKSDMTGSFSILLPQAAAIAVTVRRSGYEALVMAVNTVPVSGTIVSPPLPPSAGPISVALKPRAPAVVTLLDKTSRIVDADSIEFAYEVPFSTPIGSENASFCRGDGSSFTPHRSEIRRIIGPAARTTSSACCGGAAALRVQVQTTTTDLEPVFFTDSCAGYEMVLVARERDSGQFVHVDFTTIEEVVFP